MINWSKKASRIWENLKNCLYDKYGRLLADLYLDELHINKDMIDKKYAVQYYGKKKEKINWKEYMAINSC